MAADSQSHSQIRSHRPSQLSLLECDQILATVKRTIQEVTTAIVNGGNHNVGQRRLATCLRNVERIRQLIPSEHYEEVKMSIQNLIESIMTSHESSHSDASTSTSTSSSRPTATRRAVFSADRIPPGIGSKGGRPKLDVTKQQLEFLIEEGYSCKQMAVHMSCSTSFIYKTLAKFGLQLRKKYSRITDEELDQHVSKLHKDFPNAGQQMMAAYLHVEGIVVQRARVRASLHRIDPPSVAKRWSKVVKRRSYSVPNPNSLWHMDAHMKLVRWKLVTHGCIDGFSRCITYLNCGRDNSTLTVLNHFAQATVKYGLPSRTRSDHGGENYFVALFMELVRGPNRGSHLTGESTHNERIERLWKDVFLQVISSFYELFYSLEDENLLSVNDPLDIESLHQVFIPEINRRLHIFHEGWNRHSVRTAKHRTPRQMWLSGMLQGSTNHTAVDHIFNDRDIASDLSRALEYYGLAANALGEISELADTPIGQRVMPHVINVSRDRVYELVVEAFTSTSDNKERYELLRRWLNEEVNQAAS